MSDQPEWPTFEEPLALEALRQAQELIRSQMAASNALDSKTDSVMKAAIGLSTAALAAGALSLPGVNNAWMPGWAGVGLFVAAGLWVLCSVIAAWSLATANIAGSGITMDRMIEARLHDVPVAAAYQAIAFALGESSNKTQLTMSRSAFRLQLSVAILLAAPALGSVAAALAWLGPGTWWLVPALMLHLAVWLFFRLLLRRASR